MPVAPVMIAFILISNPLSLFPSRKNKLAFLFTLNIEMRLIRTNPDQEFVKYGFSTSLVPSATTLYSFSLIMHQVAVKKIAALSALLDIVHCFIRLLQ